MVLSIEDQGYLSVRATFNDGSMLQVRSSTLVSYLPDREAAWLKIRNRSYSQWVGQEKLFKRERGGEPDFWVWDSCVAAC